MSRRQDLFWLSGRIPVYVRGVFLNTGSGWIRNDTLTDALTAFPGEFVTDSELQGYDLLDLNGDGLADIVRTLGGATREVYLGSGRGWTRDPAYSNSLQASQICSLDGDRKGQGLMPADFDDDGLVDYFQANDSTKLAYHNNGSGLEASSGMSSVLSSLGVSFSTSDGKSTGTVLADVDGDGLSDIIVAKNGNRWLRLSSSMRSDLLVRATGPLGEVTSLTWGMSTSLNNTDADGIQQLPSAMPVATAIIRNSGRGGLYTTSYQYSGGLYEDRQFRSFARSLETLPSGFCVERMYFQQEGLAGQFFEEGGYDAQNRLRTKRSSVYEIVTASSSIKQFRRTKTTEEAIDPGGTRRSQSVMSYDDRLNVLSVHRDPEITEIDDDSTTYFSWVRNDAVGIWSLPWRVQTLGPGGSLLAESTTWYDGLPEGQVDRGLPERVSEMVEVGTYVTKRMQYDQYGNLVQVTDRSGGVGQFAYGDSTATFRTWAVDAEGRQLRSSYDSRFGEIARDVDASGNVTTREYDAFGRLSRIVLPGDESSPSGTRAYLYSALGNPSAQFYRVLETETPGSPQKLETTNYFGTDALIYRVEREAAGGRKTVTLTEFDDAGNAVRTSRPFFEGDAPLFSIIERDEMHRPIRVVEPDNIDLKLEYAGYRDPDGNILSIIDMAFGTSQQFKYDDLGRLIQAKGPYGEESYDYDAIGNLLRKGTLLFSVDPTHPQRAVCGVDASVYSGKSSGIANNSRYQGCMEALAAYGKRGDLKPTSGGNGANPNLPAFLMSYDERGNVIEKGDRAFEYDSENRLVRVFSKTGKLIEENVYDAVGQRIIQRTPQDTTVFIDGIYEENSTHASRHVRTENLVVSTVVTPRATVRLIAEAPPAMLAGNPSVWGGLFRYAAYRPWQSLLALMMGLATLCLGINYLRRPNVLREGFADVGAAFWLNPARAATVILLVPAVIMAGVGSPPGGFPMPVPQQGKGDAQSEVTYYYHSNHLGSVNVITDDRGKVIGRHDYRPYG